MSERRLTFVTYRDTLGEWRWRLKAENGQTLADSAEGYKEYSDMMHSVTVISGADTQFGIRMEDPK